MLTQPTRFLVDTGIFIREMRGEPRARDLLEHLERTGLIEGSAVTLFELVRGCQGDTDRRAVEAIFAHVTLVEVDYSSAWTAGELMREHSGVLSSERAVADALIAGTAIVRGAVLVTLNTRQFARLNVPGLDLILVPQDAPDWVAAVR